jgi:hypothetical protein
MPSTDFASLPLRSGKWSQEENDYAELLVEQFRLGLLEDELAPGSTLRAYLSFVLHCDGMRITKRYSGEDSMGKLVYTDARASREGHVKVRDFMCHFRQDSIPPRLHTAHPHSPTSALPIFAQPTPTQLEEARALRNEKRERFLFAVESQGVSGPLRRRPGCGVSDLVAELFPRAEFVNSAASGSASAEAMALPCPGASGEACPPRASPAAAAAETALPSSAPLAARSLSPPSLAAAARLPSAFAPSQHHHLQQVQQQMQMQMQMQQAHILGPPGGKSGAFVQQLAHIQALLQLEQERYNRQQAEQLMLHHTTMMRLTAAAAAAAASAVEASEAGASATAAGYHRVDSLAGSLSQLVSEGSAPSSPIGREAARSATTFLIEAPCGGGGAKRPRSVSGDGVCSHSLGEAGGSASNSGSASPSQDPVFKSSRSASPSQDPAFKREWLAPGPLRPLAVPAVLAPGLPSHVDVATLALLVRQAH